MKSTSMALALALASCTGSASHTGADGGSTNGGPAGAAAGSAGSGAVESGGADGGSGASGGQPSGGKVGAGGGSTSEGGGGAGQSAGGAGGDSDSQTAGAAGDSTAAGESGAGPGVVRTLIARPAQPRGLLSGLAQVSEQLSGAYALQAQFATDRGQWDGCTQNRLGECWYYDCPAGADPYPSAPNEALQNAGDVTFTSSDGGAAPNQLTIGILHDYWYQIGASGLLWSAPSATLTFAATGQTVPAFSLGLAAPPTARLTSLNGSPTVPTTLTRSDGIELAWQATGTGTVLFALHGFYGSKLAAECQFDAAANGGKLPAELLNELEPSPDYYFIFRGVSRVQTSVNGWLLDAEIQSYGGDSFATNMPVVELQ